MKLSDYFKKNFETSDNSPYEELGTRYYRAKAEEGMEAIKAMVKELNAKIVDENEYYQEILFDTAQYTCTAKITATTPVEIAIDFNITTFNLIGMLKGIKHIKSFYEVLDKKLTFKGTCLYRG